MAPLFFIYRAGMEDQDIFSLLTSDYWLLTISYKIIEGYPNGL
jgi:hypothetical protein